MYRSNTQGERILTYDWDSFFNQVCSNANQEDGRIFEVDERYVPASVKLQIRHALREVWNAYRIDDIERQLTLLIHFFLSYSSDLEFENSPEKLW